MASQARLGMMVQAAGLPGGKGKAMLPAMRSSRSLSLLMLNSLLASGVFQVSSSARAATKPTFPSGIDFSFAGYGGGGAPLPAPAATLMAKPSGGDDTRMLQAALDEIASRPQDKDGLRGVLLLAPGTFKVDGELRIGASGIVVRGSGPSVTKVLATGVDRRTLLEVGALEKPALASTINVTARPYGLTR